MCARWEKVLNISKIISPIEEKKPSALIEFQLPWTILRGDFPIRYGSNLRGYIFIALFNGISIASINPEYLVITVDKPLVTAKPENVQYTCFC